MRWVHAGGMPDIDGLCAWRRIAEQVVDRGGVQLLLSLPHSQHTRGFMSMALFCLSSIPQVMERLVGFRAIFIWTPCTRCL